MEIFTRIKAFLTTKSESEIRDFKERIKHRYGLSNFVYLTSEGLPIMGTFPDCDEVSAKVPELTKLLGEFKPSRYYIILTEDAVHTIITVTDDVLMFAEGTRALKEEDIKALIEETIGELRL